MKRLLVLLLLAFASIASAAVTVVDDRGTSVTLPQPPKRVVTLLPSLTETVCQLEACDRLVGVDDFSNWPEAVGKLPRVGGVNDAQVERIVGLKPDVVLLSSTARVLPRLQQLGVPVVGLDIKTLDDVRRVSRTIAQLLDVGGADRLWWQMQDGIDAAVRSVPDSMRGASVYFELSDGAYAASESSHIGQLLTRLGVRNIVPGSLGSVPKLNPEFVVRANPQVIMLFERDRPTLARRPGWSRIRAIHDNRVCAFTDAQADAIARPGPRLATGAQLLADCLAGRLTPQR
jgi:iron complex transport system substrate-binding protein